MNEQFHFLSDFLVQLKRHQQYFFSIDELFAEQPL